MSDNKWEIAKNDGLIFDEPKRIQIRVDDEINRVTKMKVMSMTPTGKSATLDITYLDWNNNEVQDTFKNVRTSYIEGVIMKS